MSVKSGQAITVLFSTADASTGAATNGDALPTGTLYVNGTANGAAVTVTNITTGLYKVAVTLPSLTAGDVVSLRVAATVGSIAAEAVVWQEVADTERVSDLNDLDAAGVRTAVGLAAANLDTQIGTLATSASIAALNDLSAAELLGTAVEGTYTFSEVLQLMAAVLFGKASGGGTTTVTFRNTGDTVDRVTATVDSDGNRTAVTLNV